MKSVENIDAYPKSEQEHSKLLAQVRESIETSAEIPSELKPELVRIADREFITLHRMNLPKTRYWGMRAGSAHYAIKNEYLDLVKQLSAASLAIATYTAATGGNPAILALTLLFAAAAVGSKLRSKGALLDPEDYHLVMTLKQLGPATLETLTETLNGIDIYGKHMWTTERTLASLQKLTAVRLGDGSIDNLVGQASDGLWSTSGI
jgi:hypothetical protein